MNEMTNDFVRAQLRSLADEHEKLYKKEEAFWQSPAGKIAFRIKSDAWQKRPTHEFLRGLAEDLKGE